MSILKNIYQKLKIRPTISADESAGAGKSISGKKLSLGAKVKKIFSRKKNDPVLTNNENIGNINVGNQAVIPPKHEASVAQDDGVSHMSESEQKKQLEKLRLAFPIEDELDNDFDDDFDEMDDDDDLEDDDDLQDPFEDETRLTSTETKETKTAESERQLSRKNYAERLQSYEHPDVNSVAKMEDAKSNSSMNLDHDNNSADKWKVLAEISKSENNIVSKVIVTNDRLKASLKHIHLYQEDPCYLAIKSSIQMADAHLLREGKVAEALRKAFSEKLQANPHAQCHYNLATTVQSNNSNIILSVYEENGSADEYLLKMRHNYASENNPIAPMLVNMFDHLMNGMQEIHEAGYLHLAISTPHILINKNHQAKLAHFRYSEKVDVSNINETLILVSATGPIKYMDKNRLKRRIVDRASDLYSLKVCMLVMLANAAGMSQFDLFGKLGVGQVAEYVAIEGNNAGLELIKRHLKVYLLERAHDKTCQDLLRIQKIFEAFFSWDDIVELQAQYHLDQARSTFAYAYDLARKSFYVR